jgi:hypothetical protein
MITLIPPLGILIDIPLGILMWTLSLQFVLGIFISEDSRLKFVQIIRGAQHTGTGADQPDPPGFYH